MQTMQVLLLIYFPLCEWRKLQCCSSSQLWLFTMWDSFTKSSEIIWFQHQGQQPLNCVQETPQHTKKTKPQTLWIPEPACTGQGLSSPREQWHSVGRGHLLRRTTMWPLGVMTKHRWRVQAEPSPTAWCLHKNEERKQICEVSSQEAFFIDRYLSNDFHDPHIQNLTLLMHLFT